MSETQQEPVQETPEAPVDTPIDTTPPVEQSPPETTQEPEAQASEPEAQPKPRRADRHIANLTAQLATQRQEREAAERRAAAAEALLQAGQTEQPQYQAPQLDVEARANQIAAERAFNQRLAQIDETGKKDIGEGWDNAKSIMTGLGATANTAFLEALAETDNPAKIFAALSEDSDELVSLLRKSPAAMAAHLGRMDAKMETPATKPPVSNAPRPPAPIRAPAVEREPDIYDERLSMKEWAALWDKQAPRHLGGRR